MLVTYTMNGVRGLN